MRILLFLIIVLIFGCDGKHSDNDLKKECPCQFEAIMGDSCFIDGIPYTGPVKEYYLNGQLVTDAYYKNGALHGNYKLYHINGG